MISGLITNYNRIIEKSISYTPIIENSAKTKKNPHKKITFHKIFIFSKGKKTHKNFVNYTYKIPHSKFKKIKKLRLVELIRETQATPTFSKLEGIQITEKTVFNEITGTNQIFNEISFLYQFKGKPVSNLFFFETFHFVSWIFSISEKFFKSLIKLNKFEDRELQFLNFKENLLFLPESKDVRLTDYIDPFNFIETPKVTIAARVIYENFFYDFIKTCIDFDQKIQVEQNKGNVHCEYDLNYF